MPNMLGYCATKNFKQNKKHLYNLGVSPAH